MIPRRPATPRGVRRGVSHLASGGREPSRGRVRKLAVSAVLVGATLAAVPGCVSIAVAMASGHSKASEIHGSTERLAHHVDGFGRLLVWNTASDTGGSASVEAIVESFPKAAVRIVDGRGEFDPSRYFEEDGTIYEIDSNNDELRISVFFVGESAKDSWKSLVTYVHYGCGAFVSKDAGLTYLLEEVTCPPGVYPTKLEEEQRNVLEEKILTASQKKSSDTRSGSRSRAQMRNQAMQGRAQSAGPAGDRRCRVLLLRLARRY